MFQIRRLLTAAAFTAAFTSIALAQDATGKVAGNVTDPSGAGIPNAKVTVTNVATDLSRTATTDSSGFYQVVQLPIGHYRVTTEASGFQTKAVDSPTALEINRTLRVDVQMSLGSVTNTVTVEGTASVVETENQTIGDTVTGRAIYELPLNGRDALNLIGTMPGVTPQNPDNGAAGSFSIGGGRTDSVTYLLDGGLNNSLLDNGNVVDPNPDAIAEFRVLESNYSAEYGRNAGGIVSEVMKSGTNQLHGTLYDYLRNNFLDANSFFNNANGLPVPILKRNQFGGTVGGPVFIPKVLNGRDKLFFFFSYEGQRQIQDVQSGQVNVFTPAEATGDFSALGAGSQVAAFLQSNPQYQPNPTLAAQGIIAPSAINPVARNYFSDHLIPTSPTGLYYAQGSATSNYDEFDGKMDYNLSSRDSLSFTASTRNTKGLSPYAEGYSSVLGYPNSDVDSTYFGSLTYTRTFTPTLLNEARFTAQRANDLQSVPAAKLPTASQLGFTDLPSDAPNGPPRIIFQGSNLSLGFSYQGPTSLINNTYVFSDNLSWTHGSHSWKFGFFYSDFQNNTDYQYFVDGAFYFYGPSTNVGSGLDLADFLLGLGDEYYQAGAALNNIRSFQTAGYAQDSWRVTKRLTLDLGLRYEYAQPKYDTQGKSFSYIPGLQSQRFPNAPTGLVFPGDPGAPRGSNFADKKNWGPRFGFAWDVFGNAKTSVRGGFGVFYDILKGEDNLQFNGQEPFYGSVDILSTAATKTTPSIPVLLNDPFGSTGTANPFPSQPPTKDVQFALPFGGSSVYFDDPNLRTPRIYQYNLSLEQQLPGSLLLETSYIGYTAHGLTGLTDVNPFVLGTDSRINPNFAYLLEFQNIGQANYNAGIAKLRRVASSDRFGNAFFTFGYTWSHEIDTSSGFRERNSFVPYYNHNEFRASGDTDVRQVITFSGGWELPLAQAFPRLPRLLTKGWNIYPIVSWHTGFAFDIFANLNTTPTDPGPSGAGDASDVYADAVGPITYLNPKQGNHLWFNPANFSNARLLALDGGTIAVANPYPYGTLPRNTMRGPGYADLDAALTKEFKIRERTSLELRWDVFNVFNHANFSNPDTTISDSTFGQISNTSPARIMQIAAHLSF